MKIRYIGHSGFILDENSYAIMIDCCGLTADSPDVIACTGKRLYILASHIHGDHFDRNILNFGGAQTRWILSQDIRKKVHDRQEIYYLAKGGEYRDELIRVKAYGSTDAGISFYIEAGGHKIFHAGDLNNWHWNEEETPADAAKNERAFLDELSLITREISPDKRSDSQRAAPGGAVLDAAMFPVDPRLGKDYKRGAEQFLDSIKTGLFIPMHFWDNYGAARAFGPQAESRGSRFAEIYAPGDIFEI